MHPNPWAFGLPKQQSYIVKDLTSTVTMSKRNDKSFCAKTYRIRGDADPTNLDLKLG